MAQACRAASVSIVRMFFWRACEPAFFFDALTDSLECGMVFAFLPVKGGHMATVESVVAQLFEATQKGVLVWYRKATQNEDKFSGWEAVCNDVPFRLMTGPKGQNLDWLSINGYAIGEPGREDVQRLLTEVERLAVEKMSRREETRINETLQLAEEVLQGYRRT